MIATLNGQIYCDCGSIYILTGRMGEDQFLDLMDALDDNEDVHIKSYKVEPNAECDEFGYGGA